VEVALGDHPSPMNQTEKGRLELLWDFFCKLRQRGFELGIDDYTALQQAQQAGFGWDSRVALLELGISLWAKSR
jgi:hypothetical protein